MDGTGIFKGITRNFENGKIQLMFEFEQDVSGCVDEIKDSVLTIIVKKLRKKRSLDANALLWHCLGKMAVELNADKWDIYLLMLKRYGKYTYIVVKENAVKSMKEQWRECEVVGEINVNDQNGVQMLCYFGSSHYDTKEFSALLNGVISEMKEMGIETPTSETMRRSLELWEKRGK